MEVSSRGIPSVKMLESRIGVCDGAVIYKALCKVTGRRVSEVVVMDALHFEPLNNLLLSLMDYINTKDRLDLLGPEMTDKEFKESEDKERFEQRRMIEAFRDFTNVVNGENGHG